MLQQLTDSEFQLSGISALDFLPVENGGPLESPEY